MILEENLFCIAKLANKLHDFMLCVIFLQLDSATSLITAAKNLMNAVISTVKASYVANTKVR